MDTLRFWCSAASWRCKAFGHLLLRAVFLAIFAVKAPQALATLPADTVWQGFPGNPIVWNAPRVWTAGPPSDDDTAVIDNGGTVLIDSTTDAVAKQLFIGEANNGNVIQSDGALTIEDFFGFVIGLETGSTGSYQLDGGTLQLSRISSYVGYQGHANFVQTGGQVESRSIRIGDQQAGSGHYQLDGGEILLSDELLVGNGGTGTFQQSGGTVTTQSVLRVGNIAPGAGTYTMSGGTLNTRQSVVGSQGGGRFIQSGGTHTAEGVIIALGTAANAPEPGESAYTISGDSELTATTSMVVGNGPGGSFLHESGTVNVGGLFVGTGSGDGIGSYTFESGQLTSGFVTIGQGKRGIFNHSGGTHHVLSEMIVGSLSINNTQPASKSGEYNLSAGELQISDDLRVGGTRQSGKPAEFNHTGGSNQVGGNLMIGIDSSGPATYVATGGALHVEGDLMLGLSITSEGVFHVVGPEAAIQIDGNFVMGPVNQFFRNHELAVSIAEQGLSTVNVTGAAELRGRLHVDLVGNFTPARGTTYEVLRAAGGLSGSLDLIGPNADDFELVLTPNSALLTSTIPEPTSASIVALTIVTCGCVWRRLRRVQ